MGRFSPTVLPTAQPSFTQHLAEGFDAYLQERQRKQAQGIAKQNAADAHLQHETDYTAAGGRYGTAPADPGIQVTTSRDTGAGLAPVSTSDFARQLRGDQAAPDPAASGPFAVRTPTLSAGDIAPPASAAPAPALHPGAFDATTGTFGGQPPHPAALAIAQKVKESIQLASPGRYTQMDPGHYIDQTQTPVAERERDREAQLHLSADAKAQQTALAAGFRGQLQSQKDADYLDRLLGPVDPTTGERHHGTIEATGDQRVRNTDEQGDQHRQTDAAKPKPLSRFTNFQSEDGRMWLRSVNDPTDVRPLNDPGSGKQLIGHVASSGGGGGTGRGGGMGSGGIGGIARQAAAIVGMENADENLLPFEEAARKNPKLYDGIDYFQGRIASMYDEHGMVVDNALHSAVYAQINSKNPELANYLRAAEQWALEDSSLSGKGSDFRTKLDGFISKIGPNPSQTQIDQTQKFRRTRVDELKKFQPAMEAMAERAAGGTPSKQAPGAPGAGNFTDAELIAAHNAGNRTDDTIRAWITKQRGAKKP